jgi:hypothetical protein
MNIMTTQTKRPAAKPRGVLTCTEWNEMHDFLTLALDAMGDGPDDLSRGFLAETILNQREAQKLAQRGLERLVKAVKS